MATFNGGDIVEIVCKHPTLGEFRFEAKSNESFTIDQGGHRNNDDANSITGAGTPIIMKNRVRPFFEGPIGVDFESGNEEINLSLIAESPVLGTWTVTHINGTIWKLKGTIVGDINVDSNTAQVTIKIAGGAKMERIS